MKFLIMYKMKQFIKRQFKANIKLWNPFIFKYLMTAATIKTDNKNLPKKSGLCCFKIDLLFGKSTSFGGNCVG